MKETTMVQIQDDLNPIKEIELGIVLRHSPKRNRLDLIDPKIIMDFLNNLKEENKKVYINGLFKNIRIMYDASVKDENDEESFLDEDLCNFIKENIHHVNCFYNIHFNWTMNQLFGFELIKNKYGRDNIIYPKLKYKYRGKTIKYFFELVSFYVNEASPEQEWWIDLLNMEHTGLNRKFIEYQDVSHII